MGWFCRDNRFVGLMFLVLGTLFACGCKNEEPVEESVPVEQSAESTAVPAVKESTPRALPDDRVAWLYGPETAPGFFVKKSDDTWLEFNERSIQYNFKWRHGTEEYVELLDESRGIGIRLYQERAELKTPKEKDWRELVTGKWVAKESVPFTGSTVRFEKGRLRYFPGFNGDMIPDFSHCGYMAGERPIPDVPVRITLTPDASGKRDDTAHIQEAIDRLSKEPPDKNGIRGAILLKKGTYRVGGQLKIGVGGIVLRGEGNERGNGSSINAEGKTKRDLIVIDTKASMRGNLAPGVKVTETVPLGARVVPVASTEGLRAGQTVSVRFKYNEKWVHAIGMNKLPRRNDGATVHDWKAGHMVSFDRIIESVDSGKATITLDAPVGCRMDREYGAGEVFRWRHDKRVRNVGLENLRLSSAYDRKSRTKTRGRTTYTDEKHCDHLVRIKRAVNCWVRRVNMINAINGVILEGSSKWITIRDCRIEGFVSQLTGGRRYGFHLGGNLALILRCHVKGGRHSFVMNARAAGPNAFVQCSAERTWGTSEPHHRWSVGSLFDNVRDGIAIQNRLNMGSGHGWSGAYCVVWNCKGDLVCQSPPTAQNFSFGQEGRIGWGHFGRSSGDRAKYKIRPGQFYSIGKRVSPASLYLQQFEERLGRDMLSNLSD